MGNIQRVSFLQQKKKASLSCYFWKSVMDTVELQNCPAVQTMSLHGAAAPRCISSCCCGTLLLAIYYLSPLPVNSFLKAAVRCGWQAVFLWTDNVRKQEVSNVQSWNAQAVQCGGWKGRDPEAVCLTSVLYSKYSCCPCLNSCIFISY